MFDMPNDVVNLIIEHKCALIIQKWWKKILKYPQVFYENAIVVARIKYEKKMFRGILLNSKFSTNPIWFIHIFLNNKQQYYFLPHPDIRFRIIRCM